MGTLKFVTLKANIFTTCRLKKQAFISCDGCCNHSPELHNKIYSFTIYAHRETWLFVFVIFNKTTKWIILIILILWKCLCRTVCVCGCECVRVCVHIGVFIIFNTIIYQNNQIITTDCRSAFQAALFSLIVKVWEKRTSPPHSGYLHCVTLIG